jgi:nitrogen regulatory protein PII-like uncharacterized protein
MKFVHISVHFEYGKAIEEILDARGVGDYVRYSMIESKDIEGKHFGTQVFPGNASVIQALVDEEVVEDLFEELEKFRKKKMSRHHLRAVVLPIEKII